MLKIASMSIRSDFNALKTVSNPEQSNFRLIFVTAYYGMPIRPKPDYNLYRGVYIPESCVALTLITRKNFVLE